MMLVEGLKLVELGLLLFELFLQLLLVVIGV